jgi:uncharacterized iron-regulated membrane protein
LALVNNGHARSLSNGVGFFQPCEAITETNVRRLILNIHLFIALIAGAFMVILGVTGSIMAFDPELDRLLHPQLSYVAPDRRVISLSEIGDAASRRFGGEPVVAYLPSLSPGLSSQVLLPSGIAYVNQHTGEVLGMRIRGQTFLGYVRELHVRLVGGSFGRSIVKLSGIAMLFSLASGLSLWWPIKRVSIRGKWGTRRPWFDLHNAVGIFSLLPLAILAATGTIIGFEDQVGPLIYKLTRSSPMHIIRSTPPEPAPGATAITPDEAVAIARTHIPGAIPYRVQMPKYGGLYVVALLNPRERVAGDGNVVALDPYSGQVVSLSRSSDLSRGDRVLAANEAIHTGSVLGMPGRIVVCLASTMVFVQALSGLFIWLGGSRARLSASRPMNEKGVS